MAELKASPRNKYIGKAADVLRSIRDTGDEVQIPVLGGLGSLFLGKSPEEVNEWSYGNAPMQLTPQGDRLPKMKRGRGSQVADTVFAAVDLPALRALTAAAGRPVARVLENSPLTQAARFIGDQRSPVSSVIKSRGGNWLSGSVEDALRGLKRDYGSITGQPHPEDSALNSWIDKQLTRYVKNEMATPEDPIRALAERGVLHFDPETLGQSRDILLGNAVATRRRAGTPITGMANTPTVPTAFDWENMSDAAVGMSPAKTRLKFETFREKNPWLEKLDPDTPTYHFSNPTGDLGFPHLIDELSNSINPASGLPRELMMSPESLSRVSVPQAVERVFKINQWRAAQKAEADALRANNAATVLYKEYPENNPLGLRWVELRKPEPSGNPQDAWNGNSPDTILADALKYEGDTMGHCVGGYCDDVLSGRSRIYSLRDAKGQPHVTIETTPPDYMRQPFENMPDPTGQYESLHRLIQNTRKGDGDYQDVARRLVQEHNIDLPSRIVQIKGKQNRKPNDEYLPFVQDFVRSGKWSNVGDLGNTGLRRMDVNGEVRYVTPEEFNRGFDSFASGGPVQLPPKDRAPITGGVRGNSWDIFGED